MIRLSCTVKELHHHVYLNQAFQEDLTTVCGVYFSVHGMDAVSF